MTFFRKLVNLLPWVRRARHRDVEDELRSIQELAGEDRLGNLTIAAEDARSAFGWIWLERLGQDLRYAARSMRHHASFTLLVIATVGLGIGANTAIFSFMESVMLRSLPVPDPQALVIMKWRAQGYSLSQGMSWSTGGSFRDPDVGTVSSIFPYRALEVFQNSRDVLSQAFGYYVVDRMNVATREATDSIKGHYVSGDYFQGLGLAPSAGRLLSRTDDAAGVAAVAVISERFAQRRFGSPGAAVGQVLRINDKPVVIVGIAPARFFGAEPGATPDLFLPLHALITVESPGWMRSFDNQFFWLEIMARLQPGVSLSQAQQTLAPRFHAFAESLATTDEQRRDLPRLDVQSGATGLDSLQRQYAQPIYVLTAMVAVILLIACANVANLLLTRGQARRREIAIRLSIGAGRGRVVRQLITESLLLAGCGGALGVALAWWGIDVLTALLAGSRDHFTLHAAINWKVLGVTAALAVVTGLAFGLMPALQTTRVDMLTALKDVRAVDRSASGRRLGVGRLLIAAQIALSVVLLVGAGLFGRTLAKLHAIDVGFNRDDVLLFTVRPSTVGYKGPDLNRVFEDVRVRLSALPGVRDVTLSTRPMPMGGGTTAPFALEGDTPATPPEAQAARTSAVLATVGPAFFTTMQVPIVGGRDLLGSDNAGAPNVVVVNQAFARMFGVEPASALIGRTVFHRDERFTIVGVADDAVAFGLKEEQFAIAYFPYLQASAPPGSMTFAVRTAGDPLALAAPVRDLIRQVDARLAVHDLKTQVAHIDQAITREITLARLGSWLATLALVIACIGLYAMVAFNVARRTNEIGIRMALGAPAARIVRMVLADVLLLAAVGLGVGLALSLAGARYVKALLYGIEPTDPLTLGMASLVLLICGLIAALVPAARAARIDPLRAVRQE
jgi:predicted permease